MNDFEIKRMKVELEALKAEFDVLKKEGANGTKKENNQKKDDKA